MRKKILILFTNSFPFDSFETYLENEIGYLKDKFDRIYIFSQSQKRIPEYKLPAHFYCYSNFIKTNILFKILALIFYDLRSYSEESIFVRTYYGKFSYKKKLILLMDIRKAKIFLRPVKRVLQNELNENNDVYLYSYWNDFKAIAATYLKEAFPATKAISRAHGWDVYLERNSENYLPLKRYMAHRLDAIYFVSENGKQYFNDHYKTHGNLRIARLGIVNNHPFKTRRRTGKLKITSCSNLIPLKRIELIISALGTIPENICIEWIHFGDGPEYQRLKNLAENKLSRMPNICYKLHPEYIDNSSILEHYKNGNTDVLINVSSTEGLPLSMIEAMSFGIPVIGTDVGGVSEIINHKHNGLLIDAHSSPEEIAMAIMYFHTLAENEYNKYCLNAHQTWKTRFNAKENYSDFINKLFLD